VQLGERGLEVGDVLVDLGRDCQVEGSIREWESGRICLNEGHSFTEGGIGASASAKREHAVADLQPSHATGLADHLGHLGNEARA
jgi:hypothetical protein